MTDALGMWPEDRAPGPQRGTGDVPAAVRQRAATLGEPGRLWLAQLPDLIAALEQEWELTAGPPLSGGSAAYVAPVVLTGGGAAMLKLSMPPASEIARQIRVLELAGGRGYARLLRHDAARGALLLERLGPRLSDIGLPVTRQIAFICATLMEAWRPLPAAGIFPTGAEKADELRRLILELWPALGRPCSEQVIERAVTWTEERQRAFDPARSVLLHADGHAANTLARDVGAPSFAFVDPEGLFAERAYDLAILMRGWNEELLAGDAVALGRQRCALLCRLTGELPEPVWQWGFIERVSTGLFLLHLGFADEGAATLRVAEAWL